MPVAEQIYLFFKSYFNDFITSVKIAEYFKGIQDLVNDSGKEWQRFRFSIYDVENKGRLTEQSLFKFVEYTSLRPLNYPEKPTEVL